jgi:hypothetical protein
MICPCCEKEVELEHFACKSGAKGGAAGKGEKKARSSEQARAAVEARWRKRDRILQEQYSLMQDEADLFSESVTKRGYHDQE